MNKEQFLNLITPAARESSARSGFPAGVALAQAALESNWGGSTLARKANNYFGIKAAVGAPSISLSTDEFLNGEIKNIIARFARYPSVAACFAARDAIIQSAPCYAEARGHAAEPIAFLHSLARFWATDPAYGEKLERIYLENNFAALDRLPQVASSQQPAASRQ
jgi:flagellum-specific peptidoglycan hydrolase FlgJ